MYYDDIFLQNGFIDMLCKISNQFVERLDVLSFDDVRPLDMCTKRKKKQGQKRARQPKKGGGTFEQSNVRKMDVWKDGLMTCSINQLKI